MKAKKDVYLMLCVNIRIVCLTLLQGVTCFLEKSQISVQLAF